MGATSEYVAERPVATAPDAIGPVVGWRVWDVVATEAGARLASPESGYIWAPSIAAVASCSAERAHTPPDVECGCGFYALRRAWDATAYLTRSPRSGTTRLHQVIGRVSVWDRLVEGERGWRASRAYPEAIIVPEPRSRLGAFLARFPRPARPVDELVAELGAYGVPVERLACSTRVRLATELTRRDRPLDAP